MSTTTDNMGLTKPAITDTVEDFVTGTAANVDILDKIWPVGSIYMSTANTNPTSFLGGSWASIDGRFLVGAGTDFAAGTTGGQKSMGIHTCGSEASNYALPKWAAGSGFTNRVMVNSEDYVGKNLPPYLSVYMWERTA